MTTLSGRSAVVIGGGSGVGRATVLALAAEGARVWAVARDEKRLASARDDATGPGEVRARALDATDGRALAGVIEEADPDLVVLSAGVRPRMAPIHEQTWESFSAVWNTDVRMAFEVGQIALRRPLRPGSLVVIVSSGAGLGGSSLSGGYAGAKRMQMFLADYLQSASNAAKRGVRFVALVPRQLIVGTDIGSAARDAYAAQAGVTPEKFMERFGAPLTAEAAARAIVQIARGELGEAGTMLGLTGKGVEVL
jgi:NAD(P)-dependent dehydrogenase (short-subunit alcohol dehydrogenase family)